ncbi:MAG: GDSL-type esterase/lipase family protein [Phycisphaeraceae bacterium]
MMKHRRPTVVTISLLACLLCLLIAPSALAQTQTGVLPGEPKDWKGFAKHDFEIAGRACYIVAPKHAAPGNPWVWRARFPSFHAEADLILLKRGFHIAFMNTNNMLGSDAALDHWDAFYDELTKNHGFAKQVALEGVSRGGLFVYRWAARHPDRVACIYADTPVCDFKSWPGGKGAGVGSPKDWQNVLKQYGLTEAEALTWDKNPISAAILEPIAKAKVPILHIVSLNDVVVPPTENTFVLAKRYRELGGSIDIIEVAEGTERSKGHHFTHPDPVRVADFIERHASVTPDASDYFRLRGSLDNSRIKFEREKKGKVVFVGGSITVMENGWRQMTMDYLQQRFPDTEFTFVNAGISSTGSPFAAFRLMQDAFEGGAPDLLFEEAAVNDLHIGQGDTTIKRGLEGILRRMRETSPTTDVVLMHFTEPRHSKDYRAGKTPHVIAMHEPIAEHYGVPTIHLAREVPERIDSGQFTWKDDFKNLHPSPFGHRLYASTIRRTLSAAWDQPLQDEAQSVSHELPKAIDPFSYSKGHYVAPAEIKILNGFTYHEKHDPRVGGVGKRVRPGYFDIPMLVGNKPADAFSYTFTGSAIGLVLSVGGDGAIIEYRISKGPWQTLDTKSRHRSLYLPRLHVLADELDAKKEHTLTLRIKGDRTPSVCNVVFLAVNGE